MKNSLMCILGIALMTGFSHAADNSLDGLQLYDLGNDLVREVRISTPLLIRPKTSSISLGEAEGVRCWIELNGKRFSSSLQYLGAKSLEIKSVEVTRASSTLEYFEMTPKDHSVVDKIICNRLYTIGYTTLGDLKKALGAVKITKTKPVKVVQAPEAVVSSEYQEAKVAIGNAAL